MNLVKINAQTLSKRVSKHIFFGLSAVAGLIGLNAQPKEVFAAGATKIRMEVEVSQKGTSALDILFVVDDSGSMTRHQQNLLANVDDLVSAALNSGVDLNAAVITTNTGDTSWRTTPGYESQGKFTGLPGAKVATTANGKFAEVLKQNLSYAMVTYGSGNEKPFEAVRMALSEPLLSNENAGFLRAHAGLAVFLLTDADDNSNMPAKEFVDFLKRLKNNAVTMHAAYIPSSEPAVGTGPQCDRNGESLPIRIEEALNAFGTIAESMSLCETDFSSKLSAIGSKYGEVGLKTVQLKLPPDVSTLRLTYGSQLLVGGNMQRGWTYNAAKMEIQLGPQIDWSKEPQGTKLVVEYLAE